MATLNENKLWGFISNKSCTISFGNAAPLLLIAPKDKAQRSQLPPSMTLTNISYPISSFNERSK
jgi:hypothetical protein